MFGHVISALGPAATVEMKLTQFPMYTTCNFAAVSQRRARRAVG